jgi:hypothetical protein
MSSIPGSLEHRSPVVPGVLAALTMIALVVGATGCATVRRGPIMVSAAGDLDLSGSGDPIGAAAGALLPGGPGGLRIVNLESPITARGTTVSDGKVTRLAAAPARAAIVAGRIDVASLANNHALDWGEAGRDDTRRALTGAGVRALVDGEMADVATVDGMPVRMIAHFLPPGANLAQQEDLVAHVRRARRGAAAVLVSLHWGRTGMVLPSDEQRALAAALVDAGATAVLGHGPHTIQGIERRGQALVAYSLGNLAFGCACTDVADAYAITFTIDKNGAAGPATVRPFRAGLAGAAIARDADAGLYELVTAISADLGTTLVRDGDLLRERR